MNSRQARSPGIVRRFWLAVLIPVIAIDAAAAYTLTQPPIYRASMKMVVGQGDALFQPDLSGATEPFTQTMGDLVRSDIVAQLVIDRLHLDMDSGTLLDHLQVSTKPMTAVLDISFDDTDRSRAVRILEEVGRVFSDRVHSQFSVPAGKETRPAVSATVFDPAHAERLPVQPRLFVNLGVAAALGIVLGVLALMLKERLERDARAHMRPVRVVEQTSSMRPDGPALVPSAGVQRQDPKPAPRQTGE